MASRVACRFPLANCFLALNFCRALFGALFGAILVLGSLAPSSAWAGPQDAAQDPPPAYIVSDTAAKLEKAIRKVHEDYDDYLKQKDKLVESYESLQTSLKQTEAKWSQIQNEGVIKQFAAIQSAMNSMQLSNSIGSIGSAPGGNNSANDLAMRQQLQQQLMVNRMMENMNTFMRGQELQQLGIEAQRAIRARFETIQKVMKVEEDYRQWQAGGDRFFEKYWSYTDPQKAFSSQETQAALKALQDRDKDNAPAQLAEALHDFREQGVTCVGIVGGDGSINLVLAELLKLHSPQSLPSILVLGGGTANVLALNLGLNSNPIKVMSDFL
ncbi:MAG: diacylglycerol kinase family protein, partial [Planctomycetota bacterium]